MRILVVEDHMDIGRSLVEGLREEGYAVDLARDGLEALHQARANAYDCLLLDLMIPRMDGGTVLRTLRAEGHSVPVICLTARDAVADRAQGLDAGADDYVVKPFHWLELKARIRSVIRRSKAKASPALQIGDLVIDTVRKTVRRGDRPIVLTAKEFALLAYLAHHQGQVVPRSEIWEHLYDEMDEINSNVIDVYIANLRRKVDQGEVQRLIHTRRGQGYVLSVES